MRCARLLSVNHQCIAREAIITYDNSMILLRKQPQEGRNEPQIVYKTEGSYCGVVQVVVHVPHGSEAIQS